MAGAQLTHPATAEEQIASDSLLNGEREDGVKNDFDCKDSVAHFALPE